MNRLECERERVCVCVALWKGRECNQQNASGEERNAFLRRPATPYLCEQILNSAGKITPNLGGSAI